MPGTKDQQKYIGPLEAHRVTDTHIILDKLKNSKNNRVPLGISRLYNPRPDCTQNKRKLSTTDLPSSIGPFKKSKTIKVGNSCYLY